MSEDRITAAGGWCAPSDLVIDALLSANWSEAVGLPTISVARGGIDFNASRASSPPVQYPGPHRWERQSRALQCGCPQCHVEDPRGLDCVDCPARLNPGDEDFDALYAAAPD